MFLLLLIVGGVVALYQCTVNQLSGCTSALEDEFTQSSLARSYSDDWILQINDEHSAHATDVEWNISKHQGGCQIQASTRYINKRYIGDSFLIKLPTKKVLPISEGASIYLSDIGGYYQMP